MSHHTAQMLISKPNLCFALCLSAPPEQPPQLYPFTPLALLHLHNTQAPSKLHSLLSGVLQTLPTSEKHEPETAKCLANSTQPLHQAVSVPVNGGSGTGL